jgi:ribosomal-protein-alanine N-acetyltransferase
MAEMAEIHAASFILPRPWAATEIAAILDSPASFVLAAGAPRPQAFLIGRTIAGEAELLTLAVAPAARRTGLGAGLVARFLQHAREAGAEMAFLEVASNNIVAQNLYRHAGFAIAGQRRNYYAAGIDAWVMNRAL